MYLLLHVAHGILITIVCMLREAVHLVLPRRHKSVKGEIVLVRFYRAPTLGGVEKMHCSVVQDCNSETQYELWKKASPRNKLSGDGYGHEAETRILPGICNSIAQFNFFFLQTLYLRFKNKHNTFYKTCTGLSNIM
jgi:hypothetical protein